MAQLMPEISICPRSSSKGSTDKKRIAAGAARRCSIRGRPYFLSSTLTPHQMWRWLAANRRRLESIFERRSALFPYTTLLGVAGRGGKPQTTRKHLRETIRSLGKHLICVPIRLYHESG